MSKYRKYLTRGNIVKGLGSVVGVLTIVSDAAQDGIDITKYAIVVLNGNANQALLGSNSGSDQGGQDCSTIIGQVIGWFLGCV